MEGSKLMKAQNSPENEEAGNPKHDEGDACAQCHNSQSGERSCRGEGDPEKD